MSEREDIAIVGREALSLAIQVAQQEQRGVMLSWDIATAILAGYDRALAARDAGAVRVLDSEHVVVTKDGGLADCVLWSRKDADAYVAELDINNPNYAPHRVVRVALLDPDATSSNTAALSRINTTTPEDPTDA